jgi:hypothetical protein
MPAPCTIVAYREDDLVGAQLERTTAVRGDRYESLNLVYITTR